MFVLKVVLVLAHSEDPDEMQQQTISFQSNTALISQLVERPFSEREVVGSNPGRTIPKV